MRITYDKPRLFNQKEESTKLAIGESDKESVSYGQIIEEDGKIIYEERFASDSTFKKIDYI